MKTLFLPALIASAIGLSACVQTARITPLPSNIRMSVDTDRNSVIHYNDAVITGSVYFSGSSVSYQDVLKRNTRVTLLYGGG